MLFAIHFDVALHVPAHRGELPAKHLVLVAQETAKHIRDKIFAAEGKGRSNGVELAGFNDGEGGLHESTSGLRRIAGAEGEWLRGPANDRGEERINRRGIGSALLHGNAIELEVAQWLTFKQIALFAEDDLIDQATAFSERTR